MRADLSRKGPPCVDRNLGQMSGIEKVEIRVTAENLWFLERYLNVFDFADIFPADAFSQEARRGTPVTIQTDLDFVIECNLEYVHFIQIKNKYFFI